MDRTTTQQADSERLVADVQDAAYQLNLSTRTIHRLLKRGDLKSFRCGRRVGVLTESLKEFAARGGKP